MIDCSVGDGDLALRRSISACKSRLSRLSSSILRSRIRISFARSRSNFDCTTSFVHIVDNSIT